MTSRRLTQRERENVLHYCRLNPNATQRAIADCFNISQNTVSKIQKQGKAALGDKYYLAEHIPKKTKVEKVLNALTSTTDWQTGKGIAANFDITGGAVNDIINKLIDRGHPIEKKKVGSRTFAYRYSGTPINTGKPNKTPINYSRAFALMGA